MNIAHHYHGRCFVRQAVFILLIFKLDSTLACAKRTYFIMESWISSITQCLQMLPLFCLCSESKPCRNYYLNKTMIKSDTHSSVERERDYKHGVGGIGSGESFRDEDSRC